MVGLVQDMVINRQSIASAAAGACVLLGVGITLPAEAEAWTAPQGCVVFLTVQAKQCWLSNHYRCALDPDGQTWRADFDPEGLKTLTLTDGKTVPLQILDVRAGRSLTLDPLSRAKPEMPDPTSAPSVSYLDYFMVQKNREPAYFWGMRQLLPASEDLPVVLSTVTIDGVVLNEVIFSLSRGNEPGVPIEQRRGKEYFHPDWRLVFAGPQQVSVDKGLTEFADDDRSPVDFIFPGEPGFADTKPTEDCELMVSFASEAPLALFDRTELRRLMP
jgi:hypothetical protein